AGRVSAVLPERRDGVSFRLPPAREPAAHIATPDHGDLHDRPPLSLHATWLEHAGGHAYFKRRDPLVRTVQPVQPLRRWAWRKIPSAARRSDGRMRTGPPRA